MVDPDSRLSLKDQGWPLELLKDLFREAVLNYQYDGSLTCYVDALDEGKEDEIRNMLELFEDLGEIATSEELPWSVCFTSRHYPNITIAHTENIVIDDLHGHQQDISKYVQRRLNISVSKALKEDFATEIRRKSSGVFLWVVLVVGLLNKTKDQGNIHLLRARLQGIPGDLHALFDDILGRDELDANFLPIILWSLYAARPLKATELYFAVLASTECLTATTIQWDVELVNERVLRDFVTTSSKGFLEMTTPSIQWPPIHGEELVYQAIDDTPADHDIIEFNPCVTMSVQFIHESVRGFILKHGLQRLDTSNGSAVTITAVAAHQRLVCWCLFYLKLSLAQHLSSAEDLNAPSCQSILNASSLDSNPFLEYVLTKGSCHHSRPVKRFGRCFHKPRDFDIKMVLKPGESWNSVFSEYPRDHVDSQCDEPALKSWLNEAFDYLLRYLLKTPDGTHLYSNNQNAHGQEIWDEVHIVRATVIGIMLTADIPKEPRHRQYRTPVTTLVARGPGNTWLLQPDQILENLVAATEMEDELLVYLLTAAMVHRATLTESPLDRLSVLIRRMGSCATRHVCDAIALALVRYLPQDQFLSPGYQRMVKAAQRHYPKSSEPQLSRLLIGAREASFSGAGHRQMKRLRKYEDQFGLGDARSTRNDIIRHGELLELLARYLL